MPFLIPESFAPRYIAFAPRGMRGWIDRAFYDSLGAAERADPLRLLAAPGARVVKDGRNLLVRAELPIGGAARTVWIKRFRPVGPIGWAARAFRAGKAERGWNAAFALLEAGIDTPRPLLGLRATGWAGNAKGLLAVEHAEGEPLRALRKRLPAAGPERRRLAEALAAFAAALHDAGFRHRDFSGGNIVARQRPEGGCAFSLIDVNRMRRAARLGLHARMRDLERIPLAEEEIEPFFACYAAGRADAAQWREEYKKRASRYRSMREARSPLARLAGRGRYYLEDFAALFSRR
ncbi:MAG: Lipopolysaccharide kinase (Kdo/WaaP) family protein [candidate division BRC1 bacterium ADurb.BinA364]|nr:MAG: Lipopolysaccharide kinase (Kdo/WaaP) family protein [candidate division BRC1 bacterium ADurb.BinA364]